MPLRSGRLGQLPATGSFPGASPTKLCVFSRWHGAVPSHSLELPLSRATLSRRRTDQSAISLFVIAAHLRLDVYVVQNGEDVRERVHHHPLFLQGPPIWQRRPDSNRHPSREAESSTRPYVVEATECRTFAGKAPGLFKGHAAPPPADPLVVARLWAPATAQASAANPPQAAANRSEPGYDRPNAAHAIPLVSGAASAAHTTASAGATSAVSRARRTTPGREFGWCGRRCCEGHVGGSHAFLLEAADTRCRDTRIGFGQSRYGALGEEPR